MKDKLEVGMYVRLNNSVYNTVVINRIANVYEHTILTENDGSMYEGEYSKEEIKNASHNIIDLIEVGDYLNGFKVSKIERYDTNTIINIGNSTFNVLEGEKIYTPSYDNNNGYGKIEKLKSIVTKEQFESMSYRIGE